MEPSEIEVSEELQRVLWACYEYWRGEPEPASERAVCFSWVVGPYQRRFGGIFHNSLLRRLAKLNLLSPAETSRSGRRRYYRIPDPARVESLLKNLGLL